MRYAWPSFLRKVSVRVCVGGQGKASNKYTHPYVLQDNVYATTYIVLLMEIESVQAQMWSERMEKTTVEKLKTKSRL